MTWKLPIAVVITTFNSEKFIKEAIDSVINQSKAPTEFIVVDNGSIDTTRDIVRSFGIPFFVQTEGKVGTSRNLGLAKTTSQFIKYLDADDWLESSALEQLYAGHLKTGAPYVYGQSQNFIDPTYNRNRAGFLAQVAEPITSPITLTSLVEREIFKVYGQPESDNYSWNRWLTLSLRQKISNGVIDQVVGYRRIHNENISHEHDAKFELFRLIAQKLEVEREKSE